MNQLHKVVPEVHLVKSISSQLLPLGPSALVEFVLEIPPPQQTYLPTPQALPIQNASKEDQGQHLAALCSIVLF